VSNDDCEDNDDDAEDANHEANNDDATNENVSSICDGTHSKEDYISLSCTNQSLQPNVLHQSLPHLLAPIAIPNGMPTRKSRVTALGRNHLIVKRSVPFLMKVNLVLAAAVDPLPQGLIRFNQLPSHLLMVLVGSRSEVDQLLGLF
jgi:hypothetical protein